MIRLFTVLCALVLATPAYAVPPDTWVVDPAASTINFSGTHMDKPFQGKFLTWASTILFSETDLSLSKAKVMIDTASASTGDKMYDGTLPNKEWFDVKQFPQAVFETKIFKKTGENTYEAEADLTIKGITQTIILPFTLNITDKTADMTARLTLDRLAFDVGKKADEKAEWVGRDIVLDIKLKATAP